MDDLALIHITQIESDSDLYLLHQQIHFEKLIHNTVHIFPKIHFMAQPNLAINRGGLR